MRKLFTPAITAKKLYSLFIFSAFLFMPNIGKATVLLTEHFNQATSTLATNDNVSSGAIAASGWTNINYSGAIYMSSTNLSYSGYKSTADETGGSAEYKATFGKRVATPLSASVSSGSVYVAALVKISEFTTGTQVQDYAWALCGGTSGLSSTNNQYLRLYFQASGSGLKFGISKRNEGGSSGASNVPFTSSVYARNTTHLVVAEYKFEAGDANDVVYLYVNPSKGNKPAATLTTSNASEPDISSFGSALLYSASTIKAACLIDELKVTTSWDDLWEDGESGGDSGDEITAPSPAASSITISSASIAWSAVEGADSYVLQWKVNGGSYSSDIAINKDVRSYSMSDLESETKYYVRVKTIIGEDESDWAEINFTTLAEDATMEYKDITFDKYSAKNAMPTSGTVYLAHNILDYNDATLTGDLTLNLHGKQIYMYGTHIIVPNGKTLTIYDDAGDGVITGGFAGDFMDKGLISVDAGGTLIIGEGAVVNTSDNANDYNTAIDNGSGGTVKISGAPTISGVKVDIYLNSNTITIESGKPLTNTTPYKVFRTAGVFTSGWANMGGEKPSDYFVSSASTRGVCLGPSGEGQMVSAFSLSENSNNSDIATYSGTLSNISMTRSLTSSQYNTFCLPFALSNEQLEEYFGADYDLEEFVSSSLEDEVLSLSFNKVNALEAGKPYLLQPSIDVTNPSFEGVTIAATAPVDVETEYVDFKGVYRPTELEGGNKNLLFLGAGNELFYPESTADIKGFRAYFEVKPSAGAAKRARIVKKEEGATGIESQMVNGKCENGKFIKDGQLLILRDNKTYNVLGMEYK